MVVIKTLDIYENYKYVWLKYVNGVDLSQHCARCLKGKYSEDITANIKSFRNVELERSPYYYLCGVKQYVTNMHIAFIEKEGSTVSIKNDWFSIEIENAEQIKFNDSKIDYKLALSNKKAYNTCRNWWFANWIKNG